MRQPENRYGRHRNRAAHGLLASSDHVQIAKGLVSNGGALQFAWSGSQTLNAQLAEGEAERSARLAWMVVQLSAAGPQDVPAIHNLQDQSS